MYSLGTLIVPQHITNNGGPNGQHSVQLNQPTYYNQQHNMINFCKKSTCFQKIEVGSFVSITSCICFATCVCVCVFQQLAMTECLVYPHTSRTISVGVMFPRNVQTSTTEAGLAKFCTSAKTHIIQQLFFVITCVMCVPLPQTGGQRFQYLFSCHLFASVCCALILIMHISFVSTGCCFRCLVKLSLTRL